MSAVCPCCSADCVTWIGDGLPCGSDPYSDSFVEHVMRCSSQYDLVCRKLAAEVYAWRRTSGRTGEGGGE